MILALTAAPTPRSLLISFLLERVGGLLWAAVPGLDSQGWAANPDVEIRYA
jgi:hypothetical protein